MTITRIKIGNDVGQVAQDIINYIFSYHKKPADRENHRKALISIICRVKQQYSSAQVDVIVIAWLERHLIHPFSRHRHAELDDAQKTLQDNANQLTICEMIVGLLEHGECESTSVNTFLMNELIAILNKYEPLQEDERLTTLGGHAYGALLGVRAMLRDELVKKGTALIQERKAALATQKQAEIKTVAKQTIDKNLVAELTSVLKGEGSLIHVKARMKRIEEYQPIKKIDLSQFRHIAEQVGAIAEQVISTNQPSLPKEKEKAQPQQLNVKYSAAVTSLSLLLHAKPKQAATPQPVEKDRITLKA
jgi:hypothetical protein